jgi:hypothetical protein
MLRRTHIPREAKNIVLVGAQDKNELMDYICDKIKKKTVWKGVSIYNVSYNKCPSIHPSQIDIIVWCFDWDNLEDSCKVLKKYLRILEGYDLFSLVVGFNWDGVIEEKLYDSTKFAKSINKIFDYDFFISFDDYSEDIRKLLKSYVKAPNLYHCR